MKLDALEREELSRLGGGADGAALPGRTTGSVEWRRARGELGNQQASANSEKAAESSADAETLKRLVAETFAVLVGRGAAAIELVKVRYRTK